MVKSIGSQVQRWSDLALALLVPRMTADAVCGAWVRCCVVMGARAVEGRRRPNLTSGGWCTPCYTNGRDC
jgi:hypothetical protein